MNLAPGEWKKVIGIVGVCGIASIIQKQRQRILDEMDVKLGELMPLQQPRKRSIWEHPFIAYLIENLSVIGLVSLAYKIPMGGGVVDPSVNQLKSSFQLFLRNLVLVEAGLALQDLVYTRILYSNVPWFSQKRPIVTSFDMLTDWLQCNFPATIINAAAQIALMQFQGKDVWNDICNDKDRKPLYVFPFLFKLAIARVIVDIVFHIAHRWMRNRDVYKQLHSRHHEHNKCIVATNFHFTWMDIFLEAALPAWIGLGVLAAMKKDPNATEAGLILTYIVWFEGASHSGKEIPYATVFPPLSPLINAFIDLDRDNIKYHETHHNLVRCNYGITQWLDKLVGTHRLQLQPCEIGVGDLVVKEIPEEKQ
jgi:sterol desaturase/sphingolipid hydroxylase (fatty acid hydroxylase superfamily)